MSKLFNLEEIANLPDISREIVSLVPHLLDVVCSVLTDSDDSILMLVCCLLQNVIIKFPGPSLQRRPMIETHLLRRISKNTENAVLEVSQKT